MTAKSLLMASIAAALSCGSATADPVVAELGTPHPVNPGIFGINNNNAAADSDPSDPAYIALIDALGATQARYVGGSSISFWDWRTGKYIPEDEITRIWPAEHGNWMLPLVRDVAALPDGKLGPLNYASFADAAGVDVQWLFNLTTRAEDQHAFIDFLKENGIDVKFVELDNETYFWGAEFGGGRDRAINYVKRVADLSPHIRKVFPDAEIGIVASENGIFVDDMHDEKNDAFKVWNDVITSEPYREMFDAFILHHYVMNSGTLDGIEGEDALARAFLTCPQITLDRGVKMLDDQFGGVPMWITEFNVIGYYRIGDDAGPADAFIKSTANTPWNALYQAGFWLTAMHHPKGVGVLNHHSITNVGLGWGMGLPVSETEATVTGTGQVFAHLSAIAEQAETMHAIDFKNNPELANAFADASAGALHGAALAGDKGATLVVINRSESAVELQLPGASTYAMCSYLTTDDAPATATIKLGGEEASYTQGPLTPAESTTDAGKPVTLPAFSLTILTPQ